MKFAHLADCHIGAWRDPALSELSIKSFEKAIDKCIQLSVDFIIIAGDLFNTSLPSIDSLKRATKKLNDLKKQNIRCYLIAGSHDFSPSGKTMLDVLENAGLCINVAKGNVIEEKLNLDFTVDARTSAKITGLLGKKGGLERNFYEALNRPPLEEEPGYKIFLFHTLLTELKPKSLENVSSEPISLLPKNFDYYAGGHPHFVYSQTHENYGLISYPGPLFPNSFKELEELKTGGFFLVENNQTTHIPIEIVKVYTININAEHKTVEQVESQIKAEITDNLNDKIITLRISGILDSGKPSDINFKELFNQIKEKGAYAILKNTSSLTSKEFEEIKVDITNSDELEDNLIKEQIAIDDLKETDAKELTKKLMKVLDDTKQEGERVYDFEKRIIEEIDKLL